MMFVVLVDLLQQQVALRQRIAELEESNTAHKAVLTELSATARYWLELLNSGEVYWHAPPTDPKDQQEGQ